MVRPLVLRVAEHRRLASSGIPRPSASAILILSLLASVSPVMAQRTICDLAGECISHPAASSPHFGMNPQHVPAGYGQGPVFALWDQEPYRNSDMGPLGVVLSTGEFQMTVTDFEIPGRGMPTVVSRTYRSRKDAERSLMGYNWHLSYDEYLVPGTWSDQGTMCAAIQWRMGSGFADIWVDQCYASDENSGWKAFPGFFGKIRALPSGGYQIRNADGTVKTFAQEGRDGNNFTIWMLTRIEDRNGNAITIHHSQAQRGIDRITDTLGRAITFHYDANHRIDSITDFVGRTVVYRYDAAGNLISARSPIVTGTPNGNDYPSGKTTTYRYLGEDGCPEEALKHNLKSIVDGKGQTFLTNTYASETSVLCGNPGTPGDTVIRQLYGGGTVTYGYTPLPPGVVPTANVITTQATVTDRNGNIQVHSFNTEGNPLLVQYRTNRAVRALGGGDEPDYVESYTYVDNGGGDAPMLVSRRTQSGGFNVDASGNLASYSAGTSEDLVYYDQLSQAPGADIFQKGNVIQITRTPGPRGGPGDQPQLVSRYEYETLFNQPRRITDARGHVTELTYDYQEGTYAQLTAGSPVPASVDPMWWPAGEISQFMAGSGNSNLGDLNGDLYHRGGNAIRVSEGAATDYSGNPSSPGANDTIATYTAYNDFGLPTKRRDAEYNETLYRYFKESDPDGDGINSPTPADGRTLSTALDAAGGGLLKEKVVDSTPSMPLPPGVFATPREGGQDPPAKNILLSFTYDAVGNVKTTTDGRGVRTDYTVNALNQIVKIIQAATAATDTAAPGFSYQEEFKFDANNNVIQQRSERRDDGATLSPAPARWITKDMTYDMLDRKISETISTDDVPAISLTTSYAYDGNGNPRKTIFPAGNAILRFYDERDLLFKEAALKSSSPAPTDMSYNAAIDSVTQYDYDGTGNVIQVTDPEGHVARTSYDGYERKVAGFDPAFQKSTFTYDKGGNIIEQASYGALGGPTPTPSGPPGTSYPELSRQNLYYDQLGRLRRTDLRFFKYVGTTLAPLSTDSNAALASVPSCLGVPAYECAPVPSSGDGWVTSLVAYDHMGRVVKTVDDNGHATETRYDGLGRKIKVLMNVAFPFTSDAANPLNNRNAIDYQYDANGNLTQVTETEYGADRTGASPRLLPAQQHQSVFKYDSMNRPIEAKVVGRSGAEVNLSTTRVYDSRGNVIQVTGPGPSPVAPATAPPGSRTKSYFDGLNRLVRTEAGYFWKGSMESIPSSMINPSNPDGIITTSYTYDADSRMTSIKDDNNRVTTFTYDNLSRQTRITYADGTYREVTYDRDSLATSWSHVRNTGYEYNVLTATTQLDRLHRATRIDVANASAPWVLGTQRQSFEYDGLGRITRALDDDDIADGFVSSEVALDYSSMGKVLSEKQIWRDDSTGPVLTGTNVVTSSYDGVGSRISVSYPDDRSVSFIPDELSRPQSIVDSVTGTTKYDFIGGGRILNRIYPNGTKLTMLTSSTDNVGAGYDGARRVIDFANKLSSSGANVARYTYGYDDAGNRTYERRVHEPAGSNKWKGETYAYDAVNRLLTRQEGDLSSSGGMVTPSTTQEYILDGPGNWRTHKKDAAAYTQTINSLNQYEVFNGPAGQRTLQYDFTGNLINEIAPGKQQQYTYDFLNRLTVCVNYANHTTTYRYDALGRRIAKDYQGFSHAHYVYDGDRLIQERDGSNALVMSYVYGLGSDEVLTRRWFSPSGPFNHFYHTNTLGSVTALTDSAGSVVERYKYDAYGQVTVMDGTFIPLAGNLSAVLNNILFTGRYFDPETKLYYSRARMYHPYFGRFLQRDPLGESASLNLYNYVFNNPVNATDPTGLVCSVTHLSPDQEAAAAAMMSEMMAPGGGLDSSAMMDLHAQWLEGSAFGPDMHAKYQSGINAKEEARREKWLKDKQDKRLEKLKAELKASEKDPKYQQNMENPKGVGVNFHGFGQNALKERSGETHESELDENAKEGSEEGKVEYTITARYMMKPGKFGEVSEEALKIVADAVKSVTDKLCGNVSVEITGFSLGGGPAVGLTNTLTEDYGVAGSNITTNLIDPYMADGWNKIKNPSVNVNLFTGTRSDPASIGLNWGAHLFGVGNRNIIRGGQDPKRVNQIYLYVGHTQMDSWVPGAMGTQAFAGY